MKRTILIAIDHKWRDLPGNVYLGHLLRKRGHDVFFTRNGKEFGAAMRHHPDLIVFNHVKTPARKEMVRELTQAGVAISILPTEGAPLHDHMTRLFAQDADLRDLVHLHAVWNEETRDLMLQAGSMPAERIFLTGTPRFDFYAPPLRDLHMRRAAMASRYGLDAKAKTVTFSTNYVRAGMTEAQRAFYLVDCAQFGIDRAVPEYAIIPDREDASRKYFEESLQALCTSAQGINLILRPHPHEKDSYFEGWIERLRTDCQKRGIRVALVRHEYIWDVLSNTDVLVQRSCTTGVEAWTMDLPTIEFRLNPDEWYRSAALERGSDIVRTQDELLTRIQYYLEGGSISGDLQRNRQATIREKYYKVDGQSSQRMVEAIESTLAQRPSASYPGNWRGRMASLRYRLQTFGDWKLSDLRETGLRRSDAQGRVDKQIHFCDVQEWERRFQSLPSSDPAVAMTAVGTETGGKPR